jgi:hypothetical protein
MNGDEGEPYRHDAARPKELYLHLFAGMVLVERVVEIVVAVHGRVADPHHDVAQRDPVGRSREPAKPGRLRRGCL